MKSFDVIITVDAMNDEDAIWEVRNGNWAFAMVQEVSNGNS